MASDSTGASSAQLTITGGQLQEGLYNFSVQVSATASGASTMIWQVEVANGALPPVAISVPWTSGEAVSTQVGGQLGNPTATVEGGEGCNVPSAWAWSFLLLEENGQDTILAFLNSTVAATGMNSLTITTADFRGEILIPGTSYSYAVLQTPTEAEMLTLQGTPPATLNAALALGAKAVKSLPFVADGPPTGGAVQTLPEAGYAVTSDFSATSSGWYDENESQITVAYYAFPLPTSRRLGSVTLTSDGNGGLEVTGTFQPPTIDWVNPSSPLHWKAQGGIFLKEVLDPSDAQWSTQMALGSYYMAVVATDVLGAKSAVFKPGPLVEAPPGGLGSAAAVNSLDNAMTSGDPTVILGALGSVSSIDIVSDNEADAAAATAKKMEALSSAAGVMGSSSDSLSAFGDVASNLLKSEAGADGAASAEVANQASVAMTSALDAATEGVNTAAAKSFLGAASSVGDSLTADSSSSSTAQGARSAQLRVLLSKLGSALLQQVPPGATSTVSTVENGKGTAIAVAKQDSTTAVANGLDAGGIQVPGGGLAGVAGRRLQECTTIAAQSTDYVGGHPFTYLQSSIGQNAYVAKTATLTTLELKQCDKLLVHSNWDPPIALTLPLNPQVGAPPEGYSYEPVCVRLDESSTDLPQQEWTTSSMTWLLPSSYNATSLECSAATGGGSYAAIYVPVKLEATSTSTTWTETRTYQTTVTTVPPFVPTPTDGGMVMGVALASIALIVVVGAISWQCYLGNVKVQKPETPEKILKQVSHNCQRLKEKMDSFRTPKVGIEPPATTEPTDSSAKAGTQASTSKKDAQDHFWDWANDLVQSTSRTEQPQPKQFVASKSGSPPHLPATRFNMPKPSVEKQEYFQSFAKELREIVSSGIPGMIADSDPDVVPPPPPPKRSLQNVEVKPPPAPPPWVRDATVLSTLPPPITNAERIDLRVDQAFSDWKTDFAAVSVFAPPTAEEEPPPPPPPPKHMPMIQNQMPRPPPRPIANRPSGSSGSRATPMGSKDEALRTLAKAPAMPAAAIGGNLPPVPPMRGVEDAPDSSHMPLSPPSFKAGSQLSMGVPKHQPLLPPLPKGASVQSASSATGVQNVPLPGTLDGDGAEGSQTPRGNT